MLKDEFSGKERQVGITTVTRFAGYPPAVTGVPMSPKAMLFLFACTTKPHYWGIAGTIVIGGVYGKLRGLLGNWW